MLPIYKDINKTIHERVTDLMSVMTITEKVGQINQQMYGWNAFERNEEDVYEITDILKDYVEFGQGVGALYGLHRADPWSGKNKNIGVHEKDSKRITNMVQRYIVENSRLGIPALIVEECPHGHQALNSTSYPVNITKASSFDVDLIEENAKAMAHELSNKGVHIALVSTLDLAMDPRWGRFEETFGESTYLAKEFTEATVKGFQGNLIDSLDSYRNKTVAEINKTKEQIGVVLKHAVGQGEALGGHNGGSVNMGSRAFHDMYAPLLNASRNAVGVMAAYNEIDGIPCHLNGDLFNTKLRGQYGFEGLVMADGCALDRLVDLFPSVGVTANKALEAGVDLSLWDDVYTKVEKGIELKEVELNNLDKAVYNVLSIKFLLGLFEEDFSDDNILESDDNRTSWANLNREIAEDSIVLMKNDGILPLSQDYNGKIAVVGPNANNLINQLGDYTPYQDHEYSSTVYEGIQKLYKNAEVFYELGCEIRDKKVNNIEAALDLSKSSDIIVFAIGGSSARNFNMEFMNNGALSSKGHNMDSGENVDLQSLELGGNQLELFDKLSSLGKPIITVLIHGRPLGIENIMKKSNALLSAWYPGQMGGDAVANILSGIVSPSGKLPATFPKNTGVLPININLRSIGRKVNYYDMDDIISLPFGYGLSYANIELDSIEADKAVYSVADIEKGEVIKINCTYTNKSDVDSKYTSLLFIERKNAGIITVPQELKGFSKQKLNAQENQTITFELDKSDLEVYTLNHEVKLVSQNITIHLDGHKLSIQLV